MGKSVKKIIGYVFQLAAVALMFIPGVNVALGISLTALRIGATALMIAGGLLTASASKLNLDIRLASDGHLINTRLSSETIPVLYGEMIVGGNQVFIGTGGEDNINLGIVQTVSEGPIDSFLGIYLDERDATDPFFENLVHTEVYYGYQNQQPSYLLTQAISDYNDAMRGTAYVLVVMEFNREKFPRIPAITVKARGKKVYDLRDHVVKWSDNGPLIVYDLLTNRVFGFGLDPAVIDTDSFIYAAVKVDQMGYTFNGLINSRETAQDILDKVLMSFRGFLIYTDGKYKLKIYDYDSPVMNITDDDIVEDSIEIIEPGLPETPNRVRVKFIDEELNYKVNDFIIEDREAITIDGMEREIELTLLGVTNYRQASELATYYLERQRINKTYVFSIGSKGYALELGDIVSVTSSFIGWENQSARIVGIEYLQNYEVALTLVEETPKLYDAQLNVSPHTFFTSNFPKPTDEVPNAIDVELKEELYGTKNNMLTKLIGKFRLPSGWIWYDHSQIWLSTDGQTYKRKVIYAVDEFEIAPIDEGKTVYVKIQPVSVHGIMRPLNQCTVYSKYIFGKRLPPSDVTEFWGQASIGGLRLDWLPVSDIDLDYYQIRWTSNTTTGTWNSAVVIAEKVYNTTIFIPAAKSGMYLIKAVDTSGNYSLNAKKLITDIPTIIKWNIQETITEEPTFSGSKTNMFVYDNKLWLGTRGLFDDIEDIDAMTNEIDIYGFTPASEGYCEASSIIDLDSIQSARCSAHVEFTGYDLSTMIDSIPDWDSMPSIDGDVSSVGVIPQISTSLDGNSYSDWQNFLVGDFTGKKFKFRLKAFSGNSNQYAVVTALSFTCDMPERIESGQDIVIPINGRTITFEKPFMILPKIAITIQSASSGDYYYLSNVSTTGFTIEIKNGSNSVQRSIDWMAVAY